MQNAIDTTNRNHIPCEPLIDADAAARIVDVHPKTVKRMAKRGEIPAVQFGNRWKFRAKELDVWLHSQLISNQRPCSAESRIQ